jgi:3'5'-cyclic nucleotide phosphodiesterase
LNLSRPPFQIIPGQPPEDAAAEIVAAFLSIESLPLKTSRVFKTLTDCLDLERGEPLFAAGCDLAETIDATAAVHDRPYHNSQHCCEVMLSSYFLALTAGLKQQQTAEIVLAALGHDFRHDGKAGGDIPFQLERNSVNQAGAFLLASGMDAARQRKFAALILATNTTIGLPIALACHAHHSRGAPLPEIPPSAPELTELGNDPLTAMQALILCEADILPSIGLTIGYALKLQEKLAIEWGVHLGLEDKLRFIEKQRHSFLAGNYFNPNIDKLKLTMLQRLHKINHEA